MTLGCGSLQKSCFDRAGDKYLAMYNSAMMPSQGSSAAEITAVGLFPVNKIKLAINPHYK